MIFLGAACALFIFLLGYFLGRHSYRPPEEDTRLIPTDLPILKRKAYTTGKRKPKAQDDLAAWKAEQER